MVFIKVSNDFNSAYGFANCLFDHFTSTAHTGFCLASLIPTISTSPFFLFPLFQLAYAMLAFYDLSLYQFVKMHIYKTTKIIILLLISKFLSKQNGFNMLNIYFYYQTVVLEYVINLIFTKPYKYMFIFLEFNYKILIINVFKVKYRLS